MWRAVLIVAAGCGFEHGAPSSPTDGPGSDDGSGSPCANWWNDGYAYRARIETTAPGGYTVHFDATDALATSMDPARGDVRIVSVVPGEIDREIDREIVRIGAATFLDFKVPAAGSLWLYTGLATPGPAPSDPSKIFAFAESFDAIAVGDNAAARFVPDPVNNWSVVDDGGNRVYHANGAGRNASALRGVTITDAELRVRMRVATGGGQQHDGLAARGNSMAIAAMDGFVAQLQSNINRVRIGEYTNGTGVTDWAFVDNHTIARATWYALRLRFVGDTLEFAIDGEPALTAIRPGSDGMLVGLYGYEPDVDFDDVRLRAVISPEPTTQVGADEGRCE